MEALTFVMTARHRCACDLATHSFNNNCNLEQLMRCAHWHCMNMMRQLEPLNPDSLKSLL